ncbi:response regulator [Pedobacter sp. MW01-1-1]|uniref:response regulator n=1 Tax=Pedobacter sp. MW01-1-1 TaxID=3383027 RepID=UPI003FEEE412
MSKISIALIDDHKLFRKGIASLIETFGNYEVISDTGSGADFMASIISKTLPEIVLLDLNMPIMNGLEVANWLKQEHPSIAIIVLSMVDDEESVITLIKAGVKGYLLKDSEPMVFKHALDTVANGDFYFPAFVTRYMAEKIKRPENKLELNARETDFLKLAASELTYKEIADKMCVSLRTVDGYRDALFVKLNIKNRVGLVLYAIKNKLVEI